MKYKTLIAPINVVPATSDLCRSVAGDLEIPIVIALVEKLRHKKDHKLKAVNATRVSPVSNKNNDLPKRRRSIKEHSYLNLSYTDAEDKRGIGYQPTMAILQYDDKAYDPSINGLISFVHSPTYDWYNQLMIILASQHEILDVYWDWDMKFRSFNGRDSEWLSERPLYSPVILSYLRNKQ